MRFFHNTDIPFMKYKGVFFLISGIMIIFSIFSWFKFGFNYGIEFTGGTQLVLQYKIPVTSEVLSDIRSSLNNLKLGDVVVHEYGDKDSQGRVYSVLIRVESTSEALSKRQRDVKTDISEIISDELLSAESKAQKATGKENLNATGKTKLASYFERVLPPPTNIPTYIDNFLPAEETKNLTEQQKYFRFLAQLIVNYRDDVKVALIHKFDDLKQINSNKDLVEANNGKPVNFINDELLKDLERDYFLSRFVIVSVEMVGPSVGSDLRASAINSVIFAIIGILVYITIRFKFRYGVAAILALVHDIIITVGLYALVGKPFTLAIVAALLTILGYSVNDSIVVCDRIRENINKYRGPNESFEHLVNMSINQTLSRTILTAGTVVIVLVFLFFMGGEVLSGFSFALLVGVVVGTYSSDCIVSPILVVWNNFQEKYKGKEKVRGTEYVKRSLKTLFPEDNAGGKAKNASISGGEQEYKKGMDADQAMASTALSDADKFKKKSGKRKKGITGRKRKRHH